MKKLLIKNIGQLIGITDVAEPLRGDSLRKLNILTNAYLAAEDGIIVDIGTMDSWPGISDWTNLTVVDADGRFLLPAWCDSHTHLVFASGRENEFVDRINGLSYEEIALRGGGILNSVDKIRKISENELYELSSERLIQTIKQGTGAIEIKSGYGLNLESELKLLHIIARLKDNFPIEIKSTLLAAHAVPREFKNNKIGYIRYIIEEIIPAVASEKLANYCDVFCERNYFDRSETELILNAAEKHGLKAKVHANQLSRSGGVQAAVSCKAISADHLEFLESEEINLLAGNQTIATILPAAAYFLKLPMPPVRALISAGAAVAAASDFNPGSSPTYNIHQIMSMMCVLCGLTPEEALNTVTINGAFAMEAAKGNGSFAIGKNANFIITHKYNNFYQIPYYFGASPVDKVYIKGELYS